MKRILAAIFIIAVLASGTYAAEKYDVAMRGNTKRGRIFNVANFDAKLMWRATFFSDQFRQAYENKHIKINYMGPQEAASYIVEQEYEQSVGWDFFIGMYTKKAYKKFSLESESFWNIFITKADGEKVMPISVEMVPITPSELIMFPYLNRWMRAYKVRFPKVDLSEPFKLTLRSIEGTSEMKFRVR